MSFLERFIKLPDAGITTPDRRNALGPVETVTIERGEHKTYRLDAIGQVCPFPLVEAKNAIKDLAVGDQLIIDFDCTQATDSIPNWAASKGYPVTNFVQTGDATWTITVRKA